MSQLTNRKDLLEQLGRFPESPGVYIMRNKHGVPLYIGKGLRLKSRVRSYFSDTHTDRPQIPVMLRQIHRIEWIATNNETEALILEANLIRQHKPKYNIDLRDDKHYPYIKVTVTEPFPRILITRRVEKDKARYFGPYTDVRSMRRMVSFAKRIFKMRDCNRNLPLKKPIRPCINYSMYRCSGACGGKVTDEAYRRNVDNLLSFLSGRRNDLIGELEVQMQKASQELQFEEAAMLRDQIQLIKDASRLQQVDLRLTDSDCDVFGIAFGDRHICMAVLHFRNGLLMAKRHFLIGRTTWDLSDSNHDHVLLQFYLESIQEQPDEVLIPEDSGFDSEILQQWFRQENTKKVQVLIPQKGAKKQLIIMAEKNAALYLAQKVPPNTLDDLADLQKACSLPQIPHVIEAFDISNLGESFTVAGMVQFKEGRPNKSAYRRYKIKEVEGQNDFAMMMEVVRRRLRRLRDEKKEFPDLLLIDGGKGQLHSAMGVLKEFEDAPMILSLAKQEEILLSPYRDEPVQLPESHPARKLAERIRDEVHRWAITYHRSIRGKQFGRSKLEDIAGIGKKRASLLLKRFGSIKRIQEAAVEDIAAVEGFSNERARLLKERLQA